MMGEMPYIDYIEVAPHQYIEFFHTVGQEKKKKVDTNFYDYHHICLEVSNIYEAWDAVIMNGINHKQYASYFGLTVGETE